MIDTILAATFLALVTWRILHAEPVAPDDPVLWLLAAAVVVARYVYRRAARYDAAHEAEYAQRERGE